MAKTSFDRIDKALVIVGIFLLAGLLHAVVRPGSGLNDVSVWFSLCWLGWILLVVNRCLSKLRNRNAQPREEFRKPDSTDKF